MGCENPVIAAFRLSSGEKIQAVGIDHQRQTATKGGREQLPTPLPSAQAWPNRQDRRPLEQRAQFLTRLNAMAHNLGTGNIQQTRMFRPRGHTDQTRTRARPTLQF